jgi:hypothetical protein
MPTTISGTTGITTNSLTATGNPAVTFSNSATLGAGDTTGFKNRIINGGMTIDQRNAGASVTQDTSGTQYCLDRWNIYGTVASKFTVQQNAGSVTPPAGFSYYAGCTSSSAYTVGAAETFLIQQSIEGFNTADLGWGTANAQTVTLSFWVRSSLTGTFGGSLNNSAFNYSYPYSYTINAANTWEQKTVTIAGPTAGTWIGATNGIGVRVEWSLGSGSSASGTAGAWTASGLRSTTGATSVVGTSGATFYITGVQLEVGSTATSFDVRDYGRELILCQRYYSRMNANTGVYTAFGSGIFAGATGGNMFIKFPTTMRSSPTINQSNCVLSDTVTSPAITAVSTTYAGTDSAFQLFTVASGGTQYRPAVLVANNNAAAYVELTSEL